MTAYDKTVWKSGDLITAAKMNKIENQLETLTNTTPITVSGSTPTIAAQSGTQYLCGEVSSLNITLPASGIVDVVFTSGTTATVLTITAPIGVTLKWANDFDPTALNTETTYELNIANGLGVATKWT